MEIITCRAPSYNQIDRIVHELLGILGVNVECEIDTEKYEKNIKSQYISFLKNKSLEVANPQLAEEWHPIKNGGLEPGMFSASTGEKVWWLGKCGHEWEAAIATRNAGSGCPYCSGQYRLVGKNDLSSVSPELAKEWHPTKNGSLKPEDVGPNSNKKVWWIGKCGHEWQATPNQRNAGRGCPYCANRKVLIGFNDLATIYPSIAEEWHPIKNGDLTPQMVTPGSGKKCGGLENAVMNGLQELTTEVMDTDVRFVIEGEDQNRKNIKYEKCFGNDNDCYQCGDCF